MPVKAKINGRTVINAVYALRERHDRAPTEDEIAEYLIAPKKDVQKHVRELEAARMYRRKKSKGKTVVVPWGS